MMVLETKRLSSAMNAKIVGAGSETVVLAHGYGGDQSVWDKILPYLAQHFSVLVFDWTFSDAAAKDSNLFDPAKYLRYDDFANDLIALLDELNLKASVFVGHSMSGMIGCIASIKRPDLFSSLILIAASPRYINTDDYEGGFGSSDIKQLMSSIESNFHNWSAHFASLVVDTKDSPSVEKFTNLLRKMRPEVALAVAKIVFYCDERDTLDKVTTPCTIIHTSSDIASPKSVAFYMQKKMKVDTKVEIIDCDGHFPHLTAHNELLDVLGLILGVKFDLNLDLKQRLGILLKTIWNVFVAGSIGSIDPALEN